MVKKVSLFIFLWLFFGCEDKPKELIFPTQTNGIHVDKNQDVLAYLNRQRVQSGMVAFKKNDILQKAAKNHAIYDVKHKNQGHIESKNKSYFTGKNPFDRALHVGYKSKNVSENISYNKEIIPSVDSLFTAIYHRFGFLAFDKNEVGFSWQKEGDYSSSVFVMGNSYLNEMCKNGGNKNARRYYSDVCKNIHTKIEEKNFKRAMVFENDKGIVYPYKNADDAAIYFSGEIPDPMPSCKITGNPLSVNFAPFSKSVRMESFKMFQGNKEIKNVKIITNKNDINGKFTKNQFALFPIKTLLFDTEYRGEFSYFQSGQRKKLVWNFKTKSPSNDYFYATKEQYFAIEPDKWYSIFFTPNNCNDMVTKYNTNRPSYAKFEISQKGANYLSVKASGYKNDEITLKTNNNKKITFVLQNTSEGMKKDRKFYFILGGLLFVLAIIVGIWRRM